MSRRICRRTVLAVGFLLLSTGMTLLAAEDPDWPREYSSDKGQLVLYQPQVTSWDDYTAMKARVALAFAPAGAEAPSVGAVVLAADTETDLDTHQVRIANIRITEASFPSLDTRQVEEMKKKVEAVLPDETVIALERIVANLERTGQGHGSGEVQLNIEPPVIFVSLEKAILVLIDGKPLWSPIPDSKLEYAVNTNWDLFRLEGVHYLRNQESWIKASALGGPWEPAGKLPKSFKKLPKDSNWKEVRESLPGKKITAADVPRVYVSEAPAELIVIEGRPRLSLLDGTRLLLVDNTESDLFLSNADGHFYYLVSGRWFRAENLDGPWSFAGGDLPGDFGKIPVDHPRAHVRASVPGTPEAEEAVLLSQIPQKAKVERGSIQPDVTYTGDPVFERIDGTSLHYATNSPNDVIRVGDLYYLCFQAVWFMSTGPSGPWEVTDSVPGEIYSIPPSSPVYHTTYVEVYDSSPVHVTFGYTAGYGGVYFSYGCVMYGTGWYYPPYSYWGSAYPYPIYYPYPYSYGVSAYYNPHTGTYGRGIVGYGPNGGWGYGARYNPSTGTYARGGAAWGPYAAGGWASAYNPRTGTHAKTFQGGNAYSQWGSTKVQRGDDWVRSGHYRGEEGGIAGYRTSEGSSGFVARGENNL